MRVLSAEQAVDLGSGAPVASVRSAAAGQGAGALLRNSGWGRGARTVKRGVPGAAVSGWMLRAFNITGALRAFTS